MKLRTFLFLSISLCFLIPLLGHCTEFKPSSFSISLYSPQKPFRFIVVIKSSQKLLLFEQDKNLKILEELFCATGENPGTKKLQGDSKTPEGIYFITEFYEDNKITVFGSRAFRLNYPNVIDTNQGRSGNGIFIHGTNKKLKPYSTNGCITLNNTDLDVISPYLLLNTIPVIVIEKPPAPVSDSIHLLSESDPEYSDLVSTYALLPNSPPKVSVNSLFFIQTQNQGLVSANYSLPDGNSLQYEYLKRVYLLPGVSQKWRVLNSNLAQSKAPLIAASPVIKTVHPEINQQVVDTSPMTLDHGQEVLSFVERWRKAWSGKDLATYMDCYSPTFTHDHLNIKGWRAKKRYLNKKYRFIKVTISNIVVEWTDEGAKVSFYQRYESDRYKTSGTKRLRLVNINNEWKIQSEVM